MIPPSSYEVICDSPGMLLEGLAADTVSGGYLSWVDILKGRVYVRRTEESQILRSELELTLPSATNLTSDHLVVTAGRSVYWLDKFSLGPRREVSIPSANPNLVTNEAKFDPFGNLWIGLMDRGNSKSPGELWSLAPDGEFKLHITDIGIPNTLLWDTKRDRFYFGDSLAGTIYVTHIPTSGTVRRRSEFIAPEFAAGVPDGSTLIAESGDILNCRWDGGCIVQISIDGRKVRQWDLPWRRPTDIVFELGADEVFVSTAADDRPHGGNYSFGAVIRLSL